MMSPEILYLIIKEQHKDRLREVEQKQLLDIAHPKSSVIPNIFHRIVGWWSTRQENRVMKPRKHHLKRIS